MKLFVVLLLAALCVGWPQTVASVSDAECATSEAVCRRYGRTMKQMSIKGQTVALAEANQLDQSNLLRCAIAGGISPNFRIVLKGNMYTPLIVQAAALGVVRSLQVLIDAGADLTATDWQGDTALMAAAALGRADCVRSLVAAGSDVNARNVLSGKTALFAAATCQQEDLPGRAPSIARGDHSTALTLLLNAGADLMASCCPGSDTGLTALHEAALYGCAPEIEPLVTAGASPSAPSDLARTPLHMAAQKSNAAAVRMLLKLGAEPNTVDYLRTTPLIDALAAGPRSTWAKPSAAKKACIEALLPVSNLSLTNKDGKSAFDFCINSKASGTKPLPVDDPCIAFWPTPLRRWEHLVSIPAKHGRTAWIAVNAEFNSGEAPAAASYQERAATSDL